MTAISWLFRASKSVRWIVVAMIVIGILQVSATLLFVLLTKHIIDLTTTHSSTQVWHYIYYLIGCVAGQLLLYVSYKYCEEYSRNKLQRDLRATLFPELLTSEWSGRSSHHTGDITSRLEVDLKSVCSVITSIYPSIVITLIQIVASLELIYYLSPNLALILLGSIPIIILISRYYVKAMRAITHTVRAIESKLTGYIQEHMQHRVTLNATCRAKSVVEEFSQINSELYAQSKRRSRYSILSRSAVQFGFYAGYTITFIWGINGLIHEAITFGTLSAFLQLVNYVQRPVIDITAKASTLSTTIVAAERLAELSPLSNSDEKEEESIILMDGELGVSLESLRFSYIDAPEHSIIEGLTYDFTPNSFHLIVGETGVGKSTLIRLILGILTPNGGDIRLYNKDQSLEVSKKTRANFAYVPQGNTLHSGTIRSNLLHGNPTATHAQIEDALHTAVADFVSTLPNGLDTLCGEGGEGLSEGEAQRISIARALLQRGRIMLLDEPTSALDCDTEQELLRRLCIAAEKRTIIMITHRDVAKYTNIKSILKF